MLYEVVSSQSGYLNVGQAAECDFSAQLLEHHVRAGRLARVQRGIYRLVHFPPSDHDDLVVLWLWSQQQGVFSHGTALALHELSDHLPSRHHMTVPSSWRPRRLRLPETVELYYADLSLGEKAHYGCCVVTDVTRTLDDCHRAAMSPECLQKARRDAERRGLIPTSQGPPPGRGP